MNLQEKREQLGKEAWIKNVMRVYGWERKYAEDIYNKIETLAKNQQDIPPDFRKIINDNFMDLI